jgi:hypothetical protein
MADTMNVLLMLSSAQPPHPVEEIQWHAENCARTGKTAIATTHLLGRLTRGKSVVAFYGDSALGNRYLGQGLFAGFANVDDARGESLLSAISLYANHNYPIGIRGLVELTDLHVARTDERLESLNGKLETFKPLTLENLPNGPARSLVYFIRRGD